MKTKRILFIAITVILIVTLAIVAFVACDGNSDGDGTGGGSGHQHTFSDGWDWDDTYHWHPATCGHTAERSDVEKHDFDSDGMCKCGYQSKGVYTVTFVADGQTVEIVTYSADDTSISEPSVPYKEYYEGAWADYTLDNGNITVEAVYTPIEYSIMFIGYNDQYIEIFYNIENVDEIVAPQVPEKPHYTGVWDMWEYFEPFMFDTQYFYAQYTATEYIITFEEGDFSQQYTYTEETVDSVVPPQVPYKQYYWGSWGNYQFEYNNEQVVNAVYTPIEYSVTFVADNDDPRHPSSTTVTYTVENADSFVSPEVPEKRYYTGEWEDYELNFSQDQTVYANYTPIEYTVTFVADDFSQQRTYTVDTWYDLVEPEVPAKPHYTGKWQNYWLQYDNEQIVNAEYTPIEYTITFVFEGSDTKVTYTVETMQDVSAPQKPEKTGYLCRWDEYELEFDNNQKVNGSYVPKTYTVNLEYGEATGDQHTFTIDFDETIVGLPQPQVYGKEFWGWFYNGTLIDANTAWQWDDDNATLTARFLNTQGVVYNLIYGQDGSDFYEVYGYNHLDGIDDVRILDTYKDMPVTSIRSSAFSSCSELISITIPSTVTSIGNSAFESCSQLTTVYWNATNCTNAWSIFTNCSLLSNIVFGENVQTIPSGAFANCSNLTEITIPSTVTSIGQSAFANCSNLQTVTFDGDSQLQNIGSSTFYNCSSLTEIIIAIAVTSIDSRAFNECSHLIIYCEAAEQPSGWDSNWNSSDCPVVWNCLHNNLDTDGYIYIVVKGVRYALKDDTATVVSYNYSGDVTISSQVEYNGKQYPVTSIGDSAFSECSSLTEITIPGSVTSIGNGAFYECANLQTVTFDGDSQLQSIRGGAFLYCSSLTEITIPSTVTSIGYNAFYGCSSLKEITIPASVTTISDGAFLDCSQLTTVYWNATNCTKDGSNWNGVFSSSLSQLVIGANVQTIPDYLFLNWNGLQTVTFDGDSQLQNIGGNAFAHCSSLTEITIPSTVTTIGEYSFRGTGLQTVTFKIDSQLQSIGECAFLDCSNLTEIIIPSTVTSIGYYAFNGCTNLQTVTFDGDSQLQSIGVQVFYNCSKLKSITIPSTVTFIGANAFLGCSGLQTVRFENPDGWKANDNSLVLTDPAQNAVYLTDENMYSRSYWTRS